MLDNIANSGLHRTRVCGLYHSLHYFLQTEDRPSMFYWIYVVHKMCCIISSWFGELANTLFWFLWPHSLYSLLASAVHRLGPLTHNLCPKQGSCRFSPQASVQPGADHAPKNGTRTQERNLPIGWRISNWYRTSFSE